MTLNEVMKGVTHMLENIREHLRKENELLKMWTGLIMAAYLVFDRWNFAAAVRSGTVGAGLVFAYIGVMCWLVMPELETSDEDDMEE